MNKVFINYMTLRHQVLEERLTLAQLAEHYKVSTATMTTTLKNVKLYDQRNTGRAKVIITGAPTDNNENGANLDSENREVNTESATLTEERA
jgi:hypothetical protein